jgi:hypothetical protein
MSTSRYSPERSTEVPLLALLYTKQGLFFCLADSCHSCQIKPSVNILEVKQYFRTESQYCRFIKPSFRAGLLLSLRVGSVMPPANAHIIAPQ